MTIDEIIAIIKSGEPMDLADSRLAFKVVFGKKPPIGWLVDELRGYITDKVREDYPEQFDDLNHADSDMTYESWLRGSVAGFKCISRTGKVSYVYLNPSSEDSEGKPNVFVYQGPHGDPLLDSALTHIVIEP